MSSYYEAKRRRRRRDPFYLALAKIFRDGRKKARSAKFEREWASACARELAYMKYGYDAGHAVALYDALSFCEEHNRPVPSWVYDALRPEGKRLALGERTPKKTARPPVAKQRQLEFDSLCLASVLDFRRERGPRGRSLTWERAFELTAEGFNRLGQHCTSDVVRKAYSRAKKRGRDFYFSRTVARL